MGTLHFGLNSWPVRSRGIFVQNLPQLFFLSKEFSIFFFWTRNMLSTCFGAKIPTLYYCWNSWPVGQKGIFVQVYLIFIFFFSIEFYTCFCGLWIYYLPVFMQKWRHCILVEILDQSEIGAFSYKIYTNYFFFPKNFPFFSLTTKYAICMFWCKNANIVLRPKFLTSWTKGHIRTIFTRVIFSIFFFYRIFHLFLRPLNILSTRFRAKMETLHSGWNSLPIGTMGIFVQILINFFFLSKVFSIFLLDY